MLCSKVTAVACNQSCVACAVSWSVILLKEKTVASVRIASTTNFGIKLAKLVVSITILRSRRQNEDDSKPSAIEKHCT